MKIKTNSDGDMLASGTVYARVVLPPGFNVALNVSRVLPDVLVFDGEVPEEGGNRAPDSRGIPPAPPLPDPLPERAFGHIRPDNWVPSSSVPVASDAGDGSAVEVFAKIVDVPLEVLPGRDREFRNFVGKVRSSSFPPRHLALLCNDHRLYSARAARSPEYKEQLPLR